MRGAAQTGGTGEPVRVGKTLGRAGRLEVVQTDARDVLSCGLATTWRTRSSASAPVRLRSIAAINLPVMPKSRSAIRMPSA